jgi:hypothetical protein
MKRKSLEEGAVMRWEREAGFPQWRRAEERALVAVHDEQETSSQDFSYLLKHAGQQPDSGL